MSTTAHDWGLTGKTAWITGAASGMGANHALRLARAGCRLGLIDLAAPALEGVCRQLEDGGHEVLAETADVSDWPAMLQASERLAAALGPVDIVVANAGILGGTEPVVDLAPDVWARTIAVNLTGVFHTAKAAIPHLRSGGSLVLVSSVSGLRGFAGAGAYNASKHGVIGLMRTLANELAGRDIRVNAVCPGWVDTPMFDLQADLAGVDRDAAARSWPRDQLFERLVSPDDVSDAVLWLVSAGAAMVTGIALPIDGGLAERTLPPA